MSRHRFYTGPLLHIARSNAAAGTPIGGLIPTIVGEFYFDTTAQTLYMGTGTATVNDWVQITGGGGAVGPALQTLNSQENLVTINTGGLQVMHTFSMPANTLQNDGDQLQIVTYGAIPNNASIQIELGGTVIAASGLGAGSLSYQLESRIVRTGSAAQRFIGRFAGGDGNDANSLVRMSDGAGTEDFTTGLVIRTRGQSPSGGNLTAFAFLVVFIPDA